MIKLFIATIALVGTGAVMRRRQPVRAWERLAQLTENEADVGAGDRGEVWEHYAGELKHLGDRLGRAGFFSPAERQRAKRCAVAVVAAGALLGGTMGAYLQGFGVVATVGGAAIGTYVGLLCWLLYLRYRAADFEREVLFQVPLVLESLILLVESGLGILPAIEQAVRNSEEGRNPEPVKRVLRVVYELAASGLPLGQALERVGNEVSLGVLRHVLLHLDISGSEGGELVPSLRSLSDHAHTEWRLSVEQRVKRLENLVVFPVFASVIGLMLLTAAVPLVPMLKLKENITQGAPAAAVTPARAAQGGELAP